MLILGKMKLNITSTKSDKKGYYIMAMATLIIHKSVCPNKMAAKYVK